MGGHDVPKPPKVPNWRIYRVEDAPQLVQVQKALAQHGLTDPWLRNEVWRFTEGINQMSIARRIIIAMTRGWKYGLLAGAITAAIEITFFPLRKPYGEEVHGHH